MPRRGRAFPRPDGASGSSRTPVAVAAQRGQPRATRSRSRDHFKLVLPGVCVGRPRPLGLLATSVDDFADEPLAEVDVVASSAIPSAEDLRGDADDVCGKSQITGPTARGQEQSGARPHGDPSGESDSDGLRFHFLPVLSLNPEKLPKHPSWCSLSGYARVILHEITLWVCLFRHEGVWPGAREAVFSPGAHIAKAA